MSYSLDQILPSLQALGLWSYWIIGLASTLEAFFVTGIFVPGTLVVDAGGVLVQQGALDFFDLVWFAAIGSILGGEISYWTGVLARKGLQSRWRPEDSAGYQKAERLFRRHGGMALVIGRFLGPVAGFVPFAASVSGIERRKFVIWNIISGFPYALGHVAFGYFLGDLITKLGPLATRIFLFAGAVTLVVAVLWWLVIRIERRLPFVLSVGRSIIRAIGDNPDVMAWAGRNPRLARFIGGRFDTTRFGGLSATLLTLALIYIFMIWLGTVFDFLMAEPIVQADVRLANLIHAFWNPVLLQVFSHITALGDWRVVTALFLAALGWLWVLRRRDLAIGLGAALIGDVITVTILKIIFHRPRPELGFFVETSGSFPSGHAGVSVAFYGMLFYLAWRLRVLGPLSAAILAATMAFLIGLSRLYLIEHYLSDVMNGWLVGALWLLIGVALAEWWRETHVQAASGAGAAPDKRLRRIGAAGSILLVLIAGWLVASYDKSRNSPPPAPVTQMSADIPALFASGQLPVNTESIIGTPLEPINTILLAPDRAAVTTALAKAGWAEAKQPGFVALARAAWSNLTSQSDADAPITPYFWASRPNDLGFQRPAADKTSNRRHHLRLWKTRFVTAAGLRIFVGAASFDNGLDWAAPQRIAPKIDAERDRLISDLQAAGQITKVSRIQITAPRQGETGSGGSWYTDGKAAILQLK